MIKKINIKYLFFVILILKYEYDIKTLWKKQAFK